MTHRFDLRKQLILIIIFSKLNILSLLRIHGQYFTTVFKAKFRNTTEFRQVII